MDISSYLRLARLHQPTGIWLLFLPCLFGAALALKVLPDLDSVSIYWFVFLFLLGSVAMRSAGCVINDILDKKFDEKVERTKNRPLASKTISLNRALALLTFLLFLGFIVLVQFNLKTIVSGILLLPLIVLYPLTKRITYYPQVFLGIIYNFGILMSSLAILDKITPGALIIYASCIIWTVIYDTIYAFQDIADDLDIGVKSTAIRFGKNPKTVLIILSILMSLLLFCLGWYEDFALEFFLVISFLLFVLVNDITECDLNNPLDCLSLFKKNIWIGILILIAIIVG